MSKLKFAHLADLHLGAFREKKLTQLNLDTFKLSISKIINEKCNFVLFCGDIFNTAMPELEIVNSFAKEIKKLKKFKIPVYVIGGSHDYSNSNKSFIELLDTTGLIKNIAKVKLTPEKKYELIFTKNDRLKVNLAGIVGRKNHIEKRLYDNLIKPKIDSNYLNIFLFHTTIDNIKPDSMNFESQITTKTLPEGFDYYAGGHIHKNITNKTEHNAPISYSGALFPNNFKELKEETPCFNLVKYNFEDKKIKIQKIELNTYQKEIIEIKNKELDNKNPVEIRNIIYEYFNKIDVQDKLILLELSGIINGKISDININSIIKEIYEKGAFQILKNTYKLKSDLIEQQKEVIDASTQEIEEEIINRDLTEINEKELLKSLLKTDFSQHEDEKKKEYEQRVIEMLDDRLE